MISSESHQSCLLLYHISNIFHLLAALLLSICVDFLLSKFFKLLAVALFPLLHLPGAGTNPRTAAGLCSCFSQPGIRQSSLFIFPRQFLSVFKYTFKMSHIVTFCIVEPPCGRWPFPEFVFGNARVLKANISIYSKYFPSLPAVLAGKSMVCAV